MAVSDTPKIKNDRILFVDLLRILSCFFVIVNHSNSRIFQERAPSLTWFVSVTYMFFSKAAVPIFVMITGYMLLNRRETHSKYILRVVRHGCALVLFSMLYYLSACLEGKNYLNWKGFLVSLISAPCTNAFWYMYLYLGILLMIPFLQRFVSALSKQDFHVLFFWSALFFSVLPIAAHYLPQLQITHYFEVPLFNSFLALLMAGYYFRTYCTPTKKWRIPCLAGYVCATLVSVIGTYLEYGRTGGVDYLFYDNKLFLPILVGAGCLFAFASTLTIKAPFDKAVSEIGKLTFGVYLVSDLVLAKLEFVYEFLTEHQVHVLPAMLIFEIVVFAVGCILVYLLRMIPGVKKLL